MSMHILVDNISSEANINNNIPNKCDENLLLPDEFDIKKIIIDFKQESFLHLNDEKTEKIICLLTKGDYFLNTALNNIVDSMKLSNLFELLNKYFKLENCNNCINHGALAFKVASELLITVPNSVYLFYISLTDKKESCALINLCSTFKRLFYNMDQDDLEIDNKKLIDMVINYIDTSIGEDILKEKDNSYHQKSAIVFEALSFIENMFITLDNLSYNYKSDLRMSENYLFCSKFIFNTFFPLIQAILSSKIMIKKNGKESIKINELRIKILKIFERIVVSFYNTDLLKKFVVILNTKLIDDQSTIIESLMDIISPDFPNWYTKNYKIELKQDFYVTSLQLQYHTFSFILVLCNYFESTSMVDILLKVRKTYISMDDLPEFISKNNFCFSDITDKLDFDNTQSIFESSQESHNILPQYCNSIFNNFYYRIVSNALYNGFKLQQSTFDFSTIEKDYINDTIIGKETYNLSKLYKLKLDIFLTNVRIIAFVFNSVVIFSDNKLLNKDHKYKYPLHQAITPFTNFLVWICEFVFDYRKRIPQLFNILEEINMIKIRMPILTNIFTPRDEKMHDYCDKSQENRTQNIH
ncbi:hypothetical protein FG379_003288 [Cryptosporidium bovis]|uniref:uncharacterized protein n=1 Tax=Cryptosporidium bovis TaxID=310047 RepID=UPI00351A98E6|nr:hypothetical protein FG379_003288 [Cryptosporidium bovis]